jgi:hypothetical protein
MSGASAKECWQVTRESLVKRRNNKAVLQDRPEITSEAATQRRSC